MVESAPWPLVSERAMSAASSMVENASVAPKRRGSLSLHRHRVDGDDPGRPGVGGALHRVDPDAPYSHDDHDLPWLHLGGVDRGSPTGRHPATEQGGRSKGDVLVDSSCRTIPA